jgi:hypothetical protein
MTERTDADDGSALVRTLEVEVRDLRQRLEQREQVLKALNRRLLQLERGQEGDTQALQAENDSLRQELGSLRNTKVFRWSTPARDAYSRLRHTK